MNHQDESKKSPRDTKNAHNYGNYTDDNNVAEASGDNSSGSDFVSSPPTAGKKQESEIDKTIPPSSEDYASRLARKMRSNRLAQERGAQEMSSGAENSSSNNNDNRQSRNNTNFLNKTIDSDAEYYSDDDDRLEYIRDESDVALEFQDDTPAKSKGNDNTNHNEGTLPGAYFTEGRAIGVNINTRRALSSNTISSPTTEDTKDVSTVQVVAFAVDEDEVTNTRRSFIRRDIINEAVQAEEVKPINEFHEKRKKIIICIAVAIALLIGVVVGLSVGLTADEKLEKIDYTYSPSLSPNPRPVLESVLELGKLRCGIGFEGFGYQNKSDGNLIGIEVELCYAVAAAVFNDTNRSRAEFITVEPAKRWEALNNKNVDLLTILSTHTMERDIYEKSTSQGFKFTVPYFYNGLKFAGKQPFLDCADDVNVIFGECRGTRICVVKETTYSNVVNDMIPDIQINIVKDDIVLLESFVNGTCNVIATGNNVIPVVETEIKEKEYNISFESGNHTFSNEPVGIVTREDDRQWSDFVNYIMQSLFTAEANNITNKTANLFPTTSVFGDKFQFMFVNAIAAVGNYGEVYNRAILPFLKRTGRNKLNLKGNSGLISSRPFGSAFYSGQPPQNGTTIQTIRERGHLRCGIVARDGFAEFNHSTKEWSGLDVDYCRAISGGLFPYSSRSKKNDTVFVNLTGTNEEYVSLSNGSIDILSGGSWNLVNDVKEPTTREGFTFTQPYFYDPLIVGNEEAPPIALVTREDDAQWSGFVYFVVTMTFYAEEYVITKDTVFSFDKPEIRIFGDDYTSMFRDVISTVGNYGEMYNRNVEEHYPRDGTRNSLNIDPYGPQLYPLPLVLYS